MVCVGALMFSCELIPLIVAHAIEIVASTKNEKEGSDNDKINNNKRAQKIVLICVLLDNSSFGRDLLIKYMVMIEY